MAVTAQQLDNMHYQPKLHTIDHPHVYEVDEYGFGQLKSFVFMIGNKVMTPFPVLRNSRFHAGDPNQLGWFTIGYSNNAHEKDKTIHKNVSYRTMQSFLHAATQEDAIFMTINPTWCPVEIDGKGRTIDNLRFINCIGIDIDNVPEADWHKILNRIQAQGIPMPTAMNRTRKGFHLFWILDEPVRVNIKTRKVLNIYSRIATNLCDALDGDHKAKSPNVYLRITKNMYYLNEQNRPSWREMINWSILYNKLNKLESGAKKQRQAVGKKILLKSKSYSRDPVFKNLLLGLREGGRSVGCFVLGKIYRHDGYTYDETMKLALEWNEKNCPPLPPSRVKTHIKSAYRDTDENNKKLPLRTLVDLQASSVCEEVRNDPINLVSVWYKNKLSRDERTYSHGHERIDDVIEYLKQHGGKVSASQRELAKMFNCPKRSFSRILNELKDNGSDYGIVVTVDGKGCHAKTVLELIIKDNAPTPDTDKKVINLSEYKRMKEEAALQYKKYAQTGMLPTANELQYLGNVYIYNIKLIFCSSILAYLVGKGGGVDPPG